MRKPGPEAPAQPPRPLAAARLLGLKKAPRTELDLALLAHRGLPSSVIVSLAGQLGWTREQLFDKLDLASRTLHRRLQQQQPLTAPEGERLLRVARVLARAVEVFEDRNAARQWLSEPSSALAGKSPVDLLITDVGTEIVMTELGKIDFGLLA